MNQQDKALFVGHDIYRESAFGKHHPLSIIRVAGVVDLCEMMGWFDHEQFRTSPQASVEQLLKFHRSDYIEALIDADAKGTVDKAVRERYRIGTMENPLFPGVFKRASTAVGGSILAAELAMDGRVVFHPSGGTHHGRADRASGFCYFNDPVFACLTFLEQGVERVLYVDLDAHHGDGVQDAFAGDDRVLTVSIHEEKRWPHSGLVADRAQGGARNLPVPRGFNDDELDYLLENAVIPLAQKFKPQALVITCGADGLDGDPLSRLALSNGGLWRAVEKLVHDYPRAVVLGGGGYNPWTVVRCWGGLWGRLSGRELPAALPSMARSFLQSFECDLIDEDEIPEHWLTTLTDPPNTGPVRPEVEQLPGLVLH
ncbi:MAG: acetoin utilization protein AcuC [Xanthomonadales bacterium]|nr:acetoin utilization protein AcuC [Gammaproteobacteria bacterium]MBT8052991.1 acetoin utilization protein AcuC [Gammaproteobacteria bacterium]NND57883.1 acetoin utilization protein AcuC [Xanthomonadales bacterium]NNK50763.1 acetoin utilization protein AcuC [Xanthomonadales bacterium]